MKTILAVALALAFASCAVNENPVAPAAGEGVNPQKEYIDLLAGTYTSVVCHTLELGADMKYRLSCGDRLYEVGTWDVHYDEIIFIIDVRYEDICENIWHTIYRAKWSKRGSTMRVHFDLACAVVVYREV